MPITSDIKRLPAGRVQCSVTFTPEETKQAEETATKRVGQNVRIPGFRPGMAPSDMIRDKVSPESLLEETMRDLLPGAFAMLVKEQNLRPIMAPQVHVQSPSPLTVDITFIEAPEVKLKGIDKIKIAKNEPKVDAKDVDRMVSYILEQHRSHKEVDRAAASGDQVTLNFVGTDKEGKEIGGTRATGYPIVIGSNSLIPGFEEALIGLKKGDEKSFTLTFPDDYHAEHLRKQEVTFAVTVTKVEETQTPELTDAFAKEQDLGTSAAEVRDRIEKSMRAEEEGIESRRRENELFDALRTATVLELAPELVNQETQTILHDIQEQLQRQNTTLEKWLEQTQRTPETLMKEVKEEAEKRLTLRFGIEKLLEEKNIQASEEDIRKGISAQLAQIPEDQRIQAAAEFKEGTRAYDQVVWQLRIEKMVAGMMA